MLAFLLFAGAVFAAPLDAGGRDPVERWRASDPSTVVPERFIVIADRDEVDEIAAARGCVVQRQIGRRGLWALRCAGETEHVLRRFQDADVRWIEPDRRVVIDAVPTDLPLEQWHLENVGQPVYGRRGIPGVDIGAVDAWEGGWGSPEVVVAVLDTAVWMDHADLAGRAWENPGEICGNGEDDDDNGYEDDCIGWDVADDDGDVTPSDMEDYGTRGDPCYPSHGTFIAGIVAATADNEVPGVGIAPESKVMSLKITDSTVCYSTYTSVAEAVLYAVDNGADVLNMSLHSYEDSEVMREAMQAAEDNHVIVVAAAGNDGIDADDSPIYPKAFGMLDTITVASADRWGRLAATTNYGEIVDLAAPGDYIWAPIVTSDPAAYSWWSGTSFATPMVAGSAALLLGQYPGLEPDQVVAALLAGVRLDARLDCDAGDRCVETGGHLDLAAAAAIADEWATPRLVVVATDVEDGTGDGVAQLAEPVRVGVIVRNAGSGVASAVTITGEGLAFEPASVNVGDLGPGEEATVWLEGTVDACDGDGDVPISLALADDAGHVGSGDAVIAGQCEAYGRACGTPTPRSMALITVAAALLAARRRQGSAR